MRLTWFAGFQSLDFDPAWHWDQRGTRQSSRILLPGKRCQTSADSTLGLFHIVGHKRALGVTHGAQKLRQQFVFHSLNVFLGSWNNWNFVSPNGISSARSGRHLDSSSFCEILKLFPQLLSSSSSSADVTLNWIHQTVHFTKCWATSIFQLLVWLPQTHQITWPFLIPIARQLLQSLWMQISTLVISCLRPKATKQHFGRVWVTIALTEGQMDRWSRVRRTGKP